MNVLVTGCSGFVGRHLLAYVGTQLDANCIGTTRSPSNDHNTVYCELTDYRQVDDVIEQVHPELIFHAAGSFSNDFETDSLNNIVAARNILEAAVKHRPDARIMLMGSAAEYGEINANDNPVNEQHRLSPISIYGWSKAAQSLLAPMYSSRYGIKVMVARTFNLLGEGMSRLLFTGHIERQIRNVLAGEAERISVGSLDAKRDYIDIDSACAMYLAIATKGKAGEVYNVGSGRAISMRKLLDIMLNTAGLDIDIVDERADDVLKKEVGTIYADISKVTTLMR